ncbi:adenosylmethionine--8-amino-7-oxononanoate transaminase [Ghiorsea bivora]|uniref:adenosylmethionine--8-amino-7-oxononanoate transaminase n=1 Tax=Ghiorsea bivora TaxID=1485545 RepID=UPI00057032D3|nr:adenosylmethionine--8-amino-7-oxononanoate transaminase [Ghiorsea bivora]
MSNSAWEREHIWHPYAAMPNPSPIYQVESAQGVNLTLSDGRTVIDGMSSWWSAIHGYNVPELNQAIEKQLKNMAHVMFGGLTHQPAIDLAKILLEIAPNNLKHVFFADSGSVSVETALKMALQYWQGQKNTKKTKFLSLTHAYHGDTFGAMSVCDPDNSMHHLFRDILPQHIFVQPEIESLRTTFAQHHHELSAMIIEPIVQGAGGMLFYDAEVLKEIRVLCNEYNVLLIVDEIATGFGRTGKLFACEHANIQPDILCLGKALTGGYMTLAAILCDPKISQGIQKEGNILMHGPTFMANPLACAVAKASIDLLLVSPWQQRIQNIETQLKNGLKPCLQSNKVADVRVIGAIGVVEMKEVMDISSIQAKLIEQGVWLRPFGKLLYTMPPFIASHANIQQINNAITMQCS